MQAESQDICLRCVMDSTVPDIRFYPDGRCSLCRHYDEVLVHDLHNNEDGERRLERQLQEIRDRGVGRPYDCIIGVSGGVDSSYVAWLCKVRYGLRPLAVHVDNGWNTELAVANVERLVKALDIDLITQVLDWREFRDIQISFLKSGISNIEIPTDHAIWATLLQTASRTNTEYVIAGNNVATESIMPSSWLYGSKDSRLIKSIHRSYGKLPMRSYPTLSTFDYVRYLLIQGIRWIPILNYQTYVKKDAKDVLIRELGWRDYGGKHHESVFTRFFHADFLPTKFGYDLRKSYLSAEICSGQITREEALESLAVPPATAESIRVDREYVIKKLGLSGSEFDSIMAQAPRSHEDYRNSERLWTVFGELVKRARGHVTRVG